MKPEYIRLMMMIQTAKPGEEPKKIPCSFRKIEVSYMTKDGIPDTRLLGLAIPKTVVLPVSVVFIAHYGIDERTVVQNELLAHGIAVAGALGVTTEENSKMADDDLYFSSACIDLLRTMPEVDRDKIILMGGSAGGYMAMMLTAFHLNIAATVCSSGVVNFYFTGRSYMSAINRINAEALKEIPGTEEQDLEKMMEYAPYPLHGSVLSTFGYSLSDPEMYEGRRGFGPEFSPVYYHDCFSNPVLFTHNTADGLVPIDQITRKYTYDMNGESIVGGLSTRMEDYKLPPGVDCSMEEVLPEEQIHMSCLNSEIIGAGNRVQAPFDPGKKYNFVICDDGCVEAYNGHTGEKACRIETIEYIECMLKGAPEVRFDLSKEKLVLMLERYAGISTLFPGFPYKDSTIYGTPEKNRESVQSELADYIRETGEMESLSVMMDTIAGECPGLQDTVKILKNTLFHR